MQYPSLFLDEFLFRKWKFPTGEYDLGRGGTKTNSRNCSTIPRISIRSLAALSYKFLAREREFSTGEYDLARGGTRTNSKNLSVIL